MWKYSAHLLLFTHATGPVPTVSRIKLSQCDPANRNIITSTCLLNFQIPLWHWVEFSQQMTAIRLNRVQRHMVYENSSVLTVLTHTSILLSAGLTYWRYHGPLKVNPIQNMLQNTQTDLSFVNRTIFVQKSALDITTFVHLTQMQHIYIHHAWQQESEWQGLRPVAPQRKER